MALEIERKFLISGDFRPYVFRSVHIMQGYLSLAAERTVRVRIKGDKGFITVKSARSDNGLSRYEWEKEIPVEEARDLIRLCEAGIIDKTRHFVKADPYVYEIDEFHGENEGLVVAEIELPSEDSVFSKPEWLGKEVTDDERYYNSMLIIKPYTKW